MPVWAQRFPGEMEPIFLQSCVCPFTLMLCVDGLLCFTLCLFLRHRHQISAFALDFPINSLWDWILMPAGERRKAYYFFHSPTGDPELKAWQSILGVLKEALIDWISGVAERRHDCMQSLTCQSLSTAYQWMNSVLWTWAGDACMPWL